MENKRNIIEITNHPVINNITRKAQVRASYNHYEASTVEMVVNIFSFLNETELKDMFKQVVMVCDNVKINPQTFQYVQPNDEGVFPEESVGEYDFLFGLVNAKVKTQFELEEMYIGLRIDAINDKMYN